MRSRFVALLVLMACAKPDPVEKWLKDLRSEDPYTRRMAAARLGELRPGYVRFNELTIGAGPLPLDERLQRVVDALNDALMVDEGYYDLSHGLMAWAIAQLRAPGLQPGLVRCVRANQPTAGTCMDAIIKIATPDVLAEVLPLLLLDDRPEAGVSSVADNVRGALFDTGEAYLPGVRAVVEADDDGELSSTVIRKLLWRHKDSGLPPLPADGEEILVLGLGSRFAEVRYQALYALEVSGYAQKRSAEITALVDDQNENVRTKARAMLEGREWYRPDSDEREVD